MDIKLTIQELKELPTSGDRAQVAKKVQSINDFIQTSTAMINEIMLESSRTFTVKKEFEPVPIDTTSVIAYILNQTLSNMTLLKKGSETETPLNSSEINSNPPSNRIVIRKNSVTHTNPPAADNEGKIETISEQ